MTPVLEKHLGKSLSAAEVANYLGCSLVTVYRNYKNLGGIRIGSSYRFFEKRIINAVLGQTEKEVDRPSVYQGQKVSVVSSDQNKSKTMGSSDQKRKRVCQLHDPHHLLA